jgi:hypothetical protein
LHGRKLKRLMKLRSPRRLNFLSMLAPGTGRLKVRLSPYLLQNSKKKHFFPVGWHPRHPLCGASCPYRLELPQNAVRLRDEPPALHATHTPLTTPGSGEQVTPGAETTGQAEIVNTLGAPFILEGPFGEEAIDAEPDSELAADAMGMDIEDNAEGAAATADGGMIVDDDDAVNNTVTLCVFHPTYPRL